MKLYAILAAVIALLAAVGAGGVYVRGAEGAKAELGVCRSDLARSEKVAESAARNAGHVAARARQLVDERDAALRPRPCPKVVCPVCDAGGCPDYSHSLREFSPYRPGDATPAGAVPAAGGRAETN